MKEPQRALVSGGPGGIAFGEVYKNGNRLTVAASDGVQAAVC